MPLTNYATREIEFKVVYYGAEFTGKTTTLKAIHSIVDPASRGELVTLKTGADQTLHFEFLLDGVELIEGFRTKIDIYTVPGHVVFNAPRQLVLRDADGVVFVVDSQWDRMEENVKSFQNLEENLRKAEMTVEMLPVVLQYNKRDLPNIAPTNYLDVVLNNREVPFPTFETVASVGQSVLTPLNALREEVLGRFADQLGEHPAPAVPGVQSEE